MQKAIILLFLISFTSISAAESGSFSKMAWMSGDWVGEDKGHTLELSLSSNSGETILGHFKKLTPKNELRFTRFMTFEPNSEEVVLRLFPFFNPRDDFYISFSTTETQINFHRVYSNKICNLDSPDEVLNDSGDQLKCDRFPVRIVYEKLSDTEFRETYIGYQYHNGEHYDVSFSRDYKRK